MKKFLTMFFDNMEIIFLVVFVFCIVVPMLYSTIRNKKTNKILNSKTIILDTLIMNRIFVFPFYIIIILMGTGVLFSSRVEGKTHIVVAVIGCMLILLPLISMLRTLFSIINILNGNYETSMDVLKEKERMSTGSGEHRRRIYYLYFEEYYKKYNKAVSVPYKVYKNAKTNDVFYLVFVKGFKYPFVFNADEYLLIDNDVVDFKDVDILENKKTVEYKREDTGNLITLTNDFILKNLLNKNEKISVIALIGCTIFLIVAFVFAFTSGFSVILIVGFMLAIFGFVTYSKIKYLIETRSKIKNGDYRMETDVVSGINDNINFKETNELMSLTFEKHLKPIKVSKKLFFDTKEGDKFYLVYVSGVIEPIQVYDVKHYTVL